MKIIIDTKEDTKEEIKKAAEFLMQISGIKENKENSFEVNEDAASAMSSFGNMFSDDTGQSRKKEDKEDNSIRIEPY